MGTQETKAVLRRRQRRLESAPGRPRKLSREAVVAAAEAMIMRGGGTLTMRALAEALGVSAPTLYTYFDHIDDIEAAALDRIVGNIPVPDLGSPRRITDQLIEQFMALFNIEVRSPGTVPGKVGSVAWRWTMRRTNHLLQTFSDLGTDPRGSFMAYTVLVGVTLAYAAAARDAGDGQSAAERRKAMSSLDAADVESFERLRAQVPVMTMPPEAALREVLKDLIGAHLTLATKHDRGRKA